MTREQKDAVCKNALTELMVIAEIMAALAEDTTKGDDRLPATWMTFLSNRMASATDRIASLPD